MEQARRSREGTLVWLQVPAGFYLQWVLAGRKMSLHLVEMSLYPVDYQVAYKKLKDYRNDKSAVTALYSPLGEHLLDRSSKLIYRPSQLVKLMETVVGT